MSEAQAGVEEAPPKRSGVFPMLIGATLAAGLGGAGFYATYSGLLDLGSMTSRDAGHGAESVVLDVAFVPIEPILVSLSGEAQPRHLRFRADLEVTPAEAETVAALMPRILDVLNGYLRAIEVEELERQTALIRIRAQMLRRIQLVVGEGRVRDLLVTEFVLN